MFRTREELGLAGTVNTIEDVMKWVIQHIPDEETAHRFNDFTQEEFQPTFNEMYAKEKKAIAVISALTAVMDRTQPEQNPNGVRFQFRFETTGDFVGFAVVLDDRDMIVDFYIPKDDVTKQVHH